MNNEKPLSDEELEVTNHLGRWVCDYVWRDGEKYPPIKAESLRRVVDYILKLESEAAEHTRWIFTNALKTADLIAHREEVAVREVLGILYDDVYMIGGQSESEWVDSYVEFWKNRKNTEGL